MKSVPNDTPAKTSVPPRTSWRQKFMAWIRGGTSGLVLGIIAFFALDNFIDMPRDRAMRRENNELRTQLNILSHRLDVSLEVMEDIAERDNNFYRVMLQADPIADAQRYAGLERQSAIETMSSLADNELVENLTSKIDLLDRELYVQSKSFDRLRQLAQNQTERLRCIPAIQPISSKYLKQMASGYGVRVDPVYGTQKFHEGMDFSANIGTPVYATGDARVRSAKWESGYGQMVELDHGFNYTTRYAHLSKMTVNAGQSVKRGDLIGYVGNTGKSTGPHLHYEVRYRSTPQNPVNFYFLDLTPEQYNEMIQTANNAGRVMD